MGDHGQEGRAMNTSPENSKTSRARIAFGLLCSLAVCCSVMYITADAQESVLSVPNGHIGSGRDTYGPRSIESVDVKKAGLVYTTTPDTLKKGKEGRERLLDFLDKVEANIAKEVAARKKDISNLRAQMAKNMEFNQAARSKMKKMLLKKMAENAKIAKDDLAKQMRWTHKKFADTAEFESKRNKATIARSKKTREIMKKNKREGAKALHNAVLTQQKALAALDAATNAKIKKTNAHIAANAAQIKENAKKARAELDSAMNRFDSKMRNVEAEAKAGRSKLAAQAAAMDKKFREYANNKIKAEAAKTAAQFHKVRDTMAKDRAHADAALAATSAKKEANDRVAKFRTGFKADILKLSGVVEEQTTKLNKRVTDLQQTVANNKLEQAKVNNAVDAELKRMVSVGNKRYKEHLKKDKELHSLMAKNKAEVNDSMTKMADKFYAQIGDIKKQMKKDRAHQEARLAKATQALGATMKANLEAQAKVNKELTEATRIAEVNAKKALKEAKEAWTGRFVGLRTKVKSDEQKHNSKVVKLTGIVEANAIKDAKGRAELRAVSEFNKRTMLTAVHQAIAKGEARAKQLESHMKDLNKKTRAELNTKITTEISVLSKKIHTKVNELQLMTKAARAQMKAEIMEALKDEAKLAKSNLKKVIAWSEGEFTKLNNGLAAEAKKSAGERAALKAKIAADKKTITGQINNAVAAQAASLEALTNNNRAAIKKTNKSLTAHAEQMIKNAEEVEKQMAANTAAIKSSLEAARKAADTQLGAVSAASVSRYNAVVKAVEDGIDEATKKADKRFVATYKTMAENRKHHDEALAAGVSELNDKIASAAALEDARFSKTVKDLDAAKKKAREDVMDARKMMLAGIAQAKETAKAAEDAMNDQVQKVSQQIISDKAAQLRVNEKVAAEMKRLEKFSNDAHTENKKAAAEEVAALFKAGDKALTAAGSALNANLAEFKSDLTDATEELYGDLNAFDKGTMGVIAGAEATLKTKKAAVAAKLASAEKTFGSKLNSLANAITANAKWYEGKMKDVTGVVYDWKKAAGADRKAIEMEL